MGMEGVHMTTVGIVLGTFNRLASLKKSVASIRYAATTAGVYEIIVIDGGSTDGTREWLREQPCVLPIFQDGPLTGAVAAFNLGFAHCVERAYDFVCHFNDDAEFVTDDALGRAIGLMNGSSKIGEVAFEHDLRGEWKFEYINGAPYANFGVVRREAGEAVARAQGDPTGRAWWNPIYRTYGADTEFGVWLWKLGWAVHEGRNIRVHDMQAQDELRNGNTRNNKNGDSDLFWSRWRHERLAKHQAAYQPPARPRRGGGHGRSQESPPPASTGRIITRSMRGRPGNTK